MFSLPAFNGSGTVPITIEDVLNRNDYSEDEEFIPLYCFTINGYDSNGNVIRKPMLQDHAKIIGKFARTSALSPMTGFSDNRVWSTLPHPVEEYESYYSSLSGKQMTEIEYWYSRLDMNASDAVAFALEDQLDDIGGEKELLVSLLRIIDCEYYYVNIGTDKTDIFMVTSLEQFYGNAVAIQDMDFDADTKGTVVRLSCGVDDILVINIIFRNTNTWFNGAPSMEVRYDKNSSLDAVYHRVY